jgi:ubiquinone/menaquinone biosynthesis C-methylase UbiE
MTTEAIEQRRREIYEVAEAIAPTWERRRAYVEAVSTPAREWMLRELGPRAGDTVLELAAGVGETGFDAAELVGERGRLISTEFSPAMLEAARRRGAERGLGIVEYRVIDAERIQLEADSVDGVLCRFGYMLMADPARALAETRRVLRPGGRLADTPWRDGKCERTQLARKWLLRRRAGAQAVAAGEDHRSAPRPRRRGRPGDAACASDRLLAGLNDMRGV